MRSGPRVQALEKAVAAAKSNVGAAQANLARLTEMQDYLNVRAPFAGVITLRNVDTGALVTEGSTLLYRIAQTDRLRIYVNVPQADVDCGVHVGQAAKLTIPDLPAPKFTGNRDAHGQCARSHQPYAAGRGAGAEHGRAAAAGHVRAGELHDAARRTAAADSKAMRWWCAPTGRRWPW